VFGGAAASDGDEYHAAFTWWATVTDIDIERANGSGGFERRARLSTPAHGTDWTYTAQAQTGTDQQRADLGTWASQSHSVGNPADITRLAVFGRPNSAGLATEGRVYGVACTWASLSGTALDDVTRAMAALQGRTL
jgi:hypothetical protein